MYGKLFSQMYDGTLGTKGPWEALVTFQQMVILADQHGFVDMTPEALSRRTTIPLEIVQKGIQTLLEPDPASRSPDEDGRRIVPIDADRPWGWRIVNYLHYRRIRSEEERREYHRQYMRKRRAAVNQNVKESTSGDQSQPIAVSSKQYAVRSKDKGQGFALPAWVPQDAWQGFEEMRKKIRKPLTDRARNLILAELKTLGGDPVAVLNQSVQNSWSGVFPLKVKSNGEGPPWWASNEGIQAKAKEVGITAKPGESWNDLKARISAREANPQ